MKKWKKYFSFSTLKSKDFIILYSILMIGLLVRDYYRWGPIHMPITLKTMFKFTIGCIIIGILEDWIILWKKRKKDGDDND